MDGTAKGAGLHTFSTNPEKDRSDITRIIGNFVTSPTIHSSTPTGCLKDGLSRISTSSGNARSTVFADPSTESESAARASRVHHVQQRLTEILDVHLPKSPPIDSPNPGNEKHKMDERRRRCIHGGFMKELERLSEPALLALRSGQGERYEEWLEPNFYKAAVTGNNKKHNTKTAVLLAQVITSLENEIRNLRLEGENEELRCRTVELEEETRNLRKEILCWRIHGSPLSSVQCSPPDSPSSKPFRSPSTPPRCRLKT